MDITPLVPKGRQIIEKYGDGGFTITQEQHKGSIFVFPDEVLKWEVPEGSIVEAFFNHIYSDMDLLEKLARADVFLLGTGERAEQLDPHINTAFREANINVEVMDTGAACRTYNILMSEERNVAAALVAVT